ncbi:T9SS type A sorting domain-containing protein [Arcicella sp. LKC2W]|uniref:T9SS type A sorting domain-containing protein n=1 Tax=Arcicella sp. LKC2W TaxID=2984198 RepID=UPI002B2044B6|nr:T9SS type A sorting domain-containing protein [Arcicella sp. LKC2W]MEA5461933.1 T9SS type A sorting domain-containing protein [Arcicella sp. LKC2W]
MKKNILTTAIFLLVFFQIIQAQQATSITLGQVPNNICKGAAVSLSFTANGTFDATNSFKVQIRNSYTNVWTDLVTEGSNSPLKCTIPANFEENFNYYSYYVRIVATKPNIVSADTYISSLHSKPNLELIGVSQANINPYDAVGLLVKGSGSTPIKMVMNDSTVIPVYNISTSYNYSYTISPAKTNEYKIAYASNFCGVGTVSGSAKVMVNEIGIKPFLTSNENVCVGGSIKVSYSANGKFNTANKFKIGLKQGYNYNDNKEYEIDAVEKDGFIEAVIPAYIPTGIQYYARIVSSSPQAISPWTPNTLIIAEKSSVEIASASTSIFWGKEVDIKFNYTGIGPWSVKLNDGSYIYSESTSPSVPNYQNSFSGKLKPEKTTSYSIESFSGGCGVGIPNKNLMNVTVKAGVIVDSLQSGLEVCLGESFSAKYSSNENVGTIYAILSVYNYSSGYQNMKIPAVFENGIVKVTLPKNLFSLYTAYTDNYYLGLVYSNGDEIAYSKNQIKVKTLPSISLYGTNPVTLSTKGTSYIPILISGSGIMTITFEDSTTQILNSGGYYYNSNSYYNLPVQVIKTTSFKLKSISNTCGTVNTSDTRVFTISVKNPADNDIVIKSVVSKVCAGEKIKVYFNTIGAFKADNEFKVEFALSGGSPKVIGTGKTSPIEVTIPTIGSAYDYNYSLRVVSSTPTAISDYTYITVNTKPVASLTINSDLSRGLLPNEVLSLSLNRTQGIYGTNTFVFSDGSSFRDNQPYSKTFANSTNFSLKSVSNECGVGTVDGKVYAIKVVPFKITPRFYYDYYSTPYCTGNSVNYSYQINGIINTGTSFNLQIASTKDTSFKDLVTNTTDYNIRLKLPTELATGSYYLRLVSNTTPKQISSLSTINIQTPANINLTATDGTNTASIDGGSGVVLKYDLKSGSTTINTIVTDDNETVFRGILSYSPYNQTYNPVKNTTYTLKSVDNACGYGVGTGSVKVTIKPSITVNQLNIYTICSGKDITVNASSFGEFDAGNTFKFTLIDSKKNRYDVNEVSLLSGETKLKIPNNLVFDTYQLEVSSTKPIVTKTFGNNLSVITLPDATISGNTIINSGQQTYISVVNNNTKNNPSYYDDAIYVLSNDTQGYTYYGKFINVNPTKTTTYTLKSITNSCGIGKVSGSATVTVNPVTDKSIKTNFGIYSATYVCAGGQQYVYFDTQGIFSTTNKFSVQISDKNGENFKDIVSEGDKSPLKVTIPEDLPEGDNYRIRVIASDKDVSSSANVYSLNSFKTSTATLDSTTYFFSEGKPVNVKINLTGTAPWSLKFGLEELSAIVYRATASPFTIKLNPLSPISYKIFSVSDSYCVGKVSGTGIVKLELVTANEELADFEIKLFPNPTNDKVILQSDNYKHTVVQIVDNFGRKILEQDINNAETILDLSSYTSGQYFLQIERENRRKIYKIQKL